MGRRSRLAHGAAGAGADALVGRRAVGADPGGDGVLQGHGRRHRLRARRCTRCSPGSCRTGCSTRSHWTWNAGGCCSPTAARCSPTGTRASRCWTPSAGVVGPVRRDAARPWSRTSRPCSRAGLTDMRAPPDARLASTRPSPPCGPTGRADEADRLAAVVGLRAAVREWSERLAAAPGDADARPQRSPRQQRLPGAGRQVRFFDWGDAVVSHPFASALVLRSVARWVLDVRGGDAGGASSRRHATWSRSPRCAPRARARRRSSRWRASWARSPARSVWGRALVRPAAATPRTPTASGAPPLGWILQLLDGPMAAEAGRPVATSRPPPMSR